MFVWADLPIFGAIRFTTILTALVVAAIVSWRTKKGLLGPLTALAWASTYEIIYGWTAVIMHGWTLIGTSWVTAALIGWLLLAYLKKVRVNPWLSLGFVTLWGVWVGLGFYSNNATSTFDLPSEVLNVATKTWLAVCFTVGTVWSNSIKKTSSQKD